MMLPDWHFDARVVVVTGAGRGLGAAIADAFARAGARVAAIDRSVPPSGPAALALAVDVTDHDAHDGAFGRIERELGPPDVLVANAGIGIRGPALEVPAADFDRVVEVNLTRALAR